MSGICAAVDPGPLRSAFVVWNGKEVLEAGIYANEDLLRLLGTGRMQRYPNPRFSLVVERIVSYGMPVGREVFDTCVWIGRFIEVWSSVEGAPWEFITRAEVKLHLCHSARAKDSNVRQALIDLLGPPGTKKAPGLTYGIHGDLWAALGVAVTWAARWEMPFHE